MASCKLNIDQNAQISESDFGKPQNWGTTFRYLSDLKILEVICDKILLRVKLI